MVAMGTVETKLTCGNCQCSVSDANQISCSECGQNLHADPVWLSEQRWMRVLDRNLEIVYAMLFFPAAAVAYLIFKLQPPLDYAAVFFLTFGFFFLLSLHKRVAWIAVLVYGLVLVLMFMGQLAFGMTYFIGPRAWCLLIMFGASVFALVYGYVVRKSAVREFGRHA